MEFLLLVGLLIAAIPFVLPIASWVYARNTRARVNELSEAVEAQSVTIGQLNAQVAELRRQTREGILASPAGGVAQPASPAVAAPPVPLAARPPAPVPSRAPATPPPAHPVPVSAPLATVPRPPQVAAPPVTPPSTAPSVSVPPAATVPAQAVPPGATPPAVPPAAAPRVEPVAVRPPVPVVRPDAGPVQAPVAARSADAPQPPRPPRPPVMPPPPPAPPKPAFDWESLIGVKLFSGIAGVALVVAAVFFLKYSVEHGWLQPPVRVLIGISVAIALLIVCELKAARRYPVTANALDAAAIAILFATFFAAHALWNLIPASVTFGLLGIVTALAVLLSVRRESMFIAVLGLLGGFATPAMLSSGQNQPIPLFAYLMLLNIGLAWVAYRQTWPVLTTLTLVFTTIYQWGWVYKFLGQSDLTLAMGIFLIFPIATFGGLMLGRRRPSGTGADVIFEHTATIAAALPLLFAVYLSAVPAYGNRPWLLFGFLLLIDAGLLAIAIARTREVLHSVGAIVTLLVMALWLAVSYSHAGATAALVFCAVFVTFYAVADAVAEWFGRTFDEGGAIAAYAAPLLLFVLVVLARIEPAFAAPLPIFGTLLPLLLLIVWRAIASERGALYYVAAFFAIATQASWSSAHLTTDRLRTAVVIYAVFGLISMTVPFLARRLRRPLEPAGGAGLVLIASLGLLLFLSAGPIAPAALWALALLLAIINAGLFVESAAGGLPLVSIAGSIVSWLVLGSWWLRAAATVGVLPSLTVLTILSLITFGGHAWTHIRTRGQTPAGTAAPGSTLAGGLYLGLVGHLFLLFVALNREWSLPPWPWLGTLVVLSLAASTVSLVIRAGTLHAAATFAAAVIVAVWASTAGAPWGLVALAAAAAASAYALVWIPIAERRADDGSAEPGAAAVLFVGEATALLAVAFGGAPPFAAVVATHVVNLAILLALSWRQSWPMISIWALVPACLAALVQSQDGDLATGWMRLLVLSFGMYGVFIAYPLILGRRAQTERTPFVAAVLGSAMFFFSARAALNAGGYAWMVGVLPVFEGAVMALLLRQLLRLQPDGQRDLGRLALVAGASLAFVTVAIPLQLSHQWITIGWALEGAALAWLYRRIPHRGLLYSAAALLAVVFARLALNPSVLIYEPRGSMRILNWYLYAYLLCAVAFLISAWWLSPTEDGIAGTKLRVSRLLPAGAVILLFLLLNIEIADFYAVGPSIMFQFGVGVAQDLTYTIGWLLFGMALLAACIYAHNKPGRVTALALITLTTCKCFLYDLSSLGGLYRVGSFVGLAMSLLLVSVALQKFVLAKQEPAQ